MKLWCPKWKHFLVFPPFKRKKNNSIKYYISFHWESNPDQDFEILTHLVDFSRDVGFEFARFQNPGRNLECKKERTFTMHKMFNTAEEGDQYFEQIVRGELRKPSSRLSSTAEFIAAMPLHYSIMIKQSGKIHEERKIKSLN